MKLLLRSLALTVILASAILAARPLVGAIRWDAWKNPNSAFGVASTLYTDYDYRQPFYGWYNVLVANHAAIVDQEINYAADNGLDYWAIDWYPEHNVYPSMPSYAEETLMYPFRDYMASSYKSRIKFCFVLQTAWVARGTIGSPPNMVDIWQTVTVPALVTLFQDSQYLKIGNRPVIYWFSSNALSSQPDGFGASWATQIAFLRTACTNAGLGTPFVVDNNMDVSSAQTAGWQAVTSYGPSGAAPGGGGNCFDSQMAKDEANWNSSGSLLTVMGLTPVNDNRPRNYGFYVQMPTYSQWEGHLKRAFDWAAANPSKVSDPPLALIYAWNEIDEGGPGIVPTAQDGTKYLEAIRSVIAQPAHSYDQTLNANNCLIAFTGTWATAFPSSGEYENDDLYSTVTNSTATLTVPASTRFVINAIKGPNRGDYEVFLDGVSQGVINQTNATYTTPTSQYDSGTLRLGVHTIQIVNRATGMFQAGFDSIKVSRQR